MGGVDKTGRLVAVNMFCQFSVEERIFDVKLVDMPLPGGGQMKNSVDAGRLDHGRECLVEVNAGMLHEATNDSAGFATIETAVWIELVAEKPLVGDDIGARRLRHQGPGSVITKGLVLLLHSGEPARVAHGGTN